MDKITEPLEFLVIDSNAIIKGHGLDLYTKAKMIVTVPEVLDEIRDSKAKELLSRLPFTLEIQNPTPAACKQVADYAIKSGDFAQLSKTDLKLIALTSMHYQRVSGALKPLENVKQPVLMVSGKALTNSKPTPSIATNTSQHDHKETFHNSEEYEVTDANLNEGECGCKHDHSHSHHEDHDHSHSHHEEHESSPLPSEQETAEEQTENQPSNEENEGEAVEGDNNNDDEEEDDDDDYDDYSYDNDSEEDLPEQVPVDELPADAFPSLGGNNTTSTNNQSSTSSANAPKWADLAKKQAASPSIWKTPLNTITIKLSETNLTESSSVNKDTSIPTTTSNIITSTSTTPSTSATVSTTAQITTEPTKKLTKDQSQPRERAILTSSTLHTENESRQLEANDDGQGWINVVSLTHQSPMETFHVNKTNKKKKKVVPQLLLRVACFTTDFSMQNVMLQMGIPIIASDGMLVRTIRNWVLRCTACEEIHTKDLTRLFCKLCGGHTLTRVAASISETGELRLHLRKDYKINQKGVQYNMPAPGKQNRFSGELLTCEDQLLSGIWRQKIIKIQRDVKSAFGEDVTSDVGLHLNKHQMIQVGLGRRNPNAQKGRERRGKKKTNH